MNDRATGLDYLKQLAIALLQKYEQTLMENACLRAIIETESMPDGTKGISDYREKLEKMLAGPELRKIVDDKFAPLYAKIERAQQESEVLELLRQLPTTGKVQ